MPRASRSATSPRVTKRDVRERARHLLRRVARRVHRAARRLPRRRRVRARARRVSSSSARSSSLHWSRGRGRRELPAHAPRRGRELRGHARRPLRFARPPVRAPGRRRRRAARRRRRARPLPVRAGARPAHVAASRSSGRTSGATRSLRSSAVALGGDYAAVAQRVAASRARAARAICSPCTSATARRCSTSARSRTTTAPHTRSDLLFKGAVEDAARSVYSGLVRIRPDANQRSGVPDEPQPRAHRGRGCRVDPEPRDRGERRAVLAREHRRPDRRRPAVLPREPGHPAGRGRAPDRARLLRRRVRPAAGALRSSTRLRDDVIRKIEHRA